MSAILPASDLNYSQYLFVMLHLQSLQLTSLCTFSLALILCLMKLNHKYTIKQTNKHPPSQTLEISLVIIVIKCKTLKLNYS